MLVLYDEVLQSAHVIGKIPTVAHRFLDGVLEIGIFCQRVSVVDF